MWWTGRGSFSLLARTVGRERLCNATLHQIAVWQSEYDGFFFSSASNFHCSLSVNEYHDFLFVFSTSFHIQRSLWNVTHEAFFKSPLLLDTRLSLPHWKIMQSLHPSISSAARQSKTHDRAAAVFLESCGSKPFTSSDRVPFSRLTLPKTPNAGFAKSSWEQRDVEGKNELPQGLHRWQRKTEFEYHLQFRSQCLYNLPLQCLAESCWEKERNIKRGLIRRLATGYLLAS